MKAVPVHEVDMYCPLFLSYKGQAIYFILSLPLILLL